jgi:hypothetical protein
MATFSRISSASASGNRLNPEMANWSESKEENSVSNTKSPYLNPAITKAVVFGDTHDRYVVLSLGWDGERRGHGCLIHIDIIDGKVWGQKDNTDSAVARELEQAGIPKTDIVLGFYEPSVRPYTGYAIV